MPVTDTVLELLRSGRRSELVRKLEGLAIFCRRAPGGYGPAAQMRRRAAARRALIARGIQVEYRRLQ